MAFSTEAPGGERPETAAQCSSDICSEVETTRERRTLGCPRDPLGKSQESACDIRRRSKSSGAPLAVPTCGPTQPSRQSANRGPPGAFGGAPELVTTKRPIEQVETGGFGSSQGLPVRAQDDNPGNVPVLVSFGLPEGPGVGNGTAGFRGGHGVVISAGFGSGGGGTGIGVKIRIAI